MIDHDFYWPDAEQRTVELTVRGSTIDIKHISGPPFPSGMPTEVDMFTPGDNEGLVDYIKDKLGIDAVA